MIGLPAPGDHATQAAAIQAVTCPTCGRLSHHIEIRPLGLSRQGVVTTELCVCVNGHSWPLIQVAAA